MKILILWIVGKFLFSSNLCTEYHPDNDYIFGRLQGKHYTFWEWKKPPFPPQTKFDIHLSLSSFSEESFFRNFVGEKLIKL